MRAHLLRRGAKQPADNGLEVLHSDAHVGLAAQLKKTSDNSIINWVLGCAPVQGRFMALDFDADPLAELSLFRALGVDGVFVDCPATAAEWLAIQQAAPSSWIGSVIGGPGTSCMLSLWQSLANH